MTKTGRPAMRYFIDDNPLFFVQNEPEVLTWYRQYRRTSNSGNRFGQWMFTQRKQQTKALMERLYSVWLKSPELWPN